MGSLDKQGVRFTSCSTARESPRNASFKVAPLHRVVECTTPVCDAHIGQYQPILIHPLNLIHVCQVDALPVRVLNFAKNLTYPGQPNYGGVDLTEAARHGSESYQYQATRPATDKPVQSRFGALARGTPIPAYGYRRCGVCCRFSG